MPLCVNDDLRQLALAAVLPGVAEQVLEHHAQQRRIAVATMPGSISNARRRCGRRAQVVDDEVRPAATGRPAGAPAAARQARQVEQASIMWCMRAAAPSTRSR
jgi:hypothetical protein